MTSNENKFLYNKELEFYYVEVILFFSNKDIIMHFHLHYQYRSYRTPEVRDIGPFASTPGETIIIL